MTTKTKAVNLIIVQMIQKIQIITNLTINKTTVKVIVKKIILKTLKMKNLMEITYRIKNVNIKTLTILRVKAMDKVVMKNNFYLNQVMELLMMIQIYNIFKMIKRNNKKRSLKSAHF